MNLKSLQYLVAVHHHEHFSKAADACFISQPTLSMQIQKLEKYLGVQLIERTNKRVMFTDIGEKIVKRANKLLLISDDIKCIAKYAGEPNTGLVKIGLIPTVAPYLLSYIVPQLKKKFQNVHWQFFEEKTKELVNKVSEGIIDVGIGALPMSNILLQEKIAYQETFKVAVPQSHRFSEKQHIDYHQLIKEPVLLLQEGHCLRDQALDICRAIPAKTFTATSLETLRFMVVAGEGVTLLPTMACHKMTGIEYIPLKGKAPTRKIGLIWRKTTSRHTLFSEFIHIIINRLARTEGIIVAK